MKPKKRMRCYRGGFLRTQFPFMLCGLTILILLLFQNSVVKNADNLAMYRFDFLLSVKFSPTSFFGHVGKIISVTAPNLLMKINRFHFKSIPFFGLHIPFQADFRINVQPERKIGTQDLS